MQLYHSISKYIEEYFYLVYKYYAKHAIPFFVTYYNIDIDKTVWEDQSLMSGPYERIGSLSGLKWKKFLLVPVFYIEETNSQMSAEESGYQDLGGDTSFVIPTEFGFEPYVFDLVKPYCIHPIQPEGANYPLLKVVGVERSTQTNITFTKLKAETEQSITEEQIQPQVTDVYMFLEYTKKLYPLDIAQSLLVIMDKNQSVVSELNRKFDSVSGLYLLNV